MSLTRTDPFMSEVRTLVSRYRSPSDVIDGIHRLDEMMMQNDLLQVLLRILCGSLVNRMTDDARYGDRAVKQIVASFAALGYKREEPTYYEYAAVARDVVIAYRKERGSRNVEQAIIAAMEWAVSKKQRDGSIFWYHVVNHFSGHRRPSSLYGSKSGARERAHRKIEAGLIDLEAIDDEPDEETRGVLVNAVGILSQPETGTSRPSTPRNDDYLAWLRSMPCLITASSPSEPHHAVGHKGTSTRASDYGAVPLSRTLHDELHQQGRSTFEAKYRIDLTEAAFNYVHLWLTGYTITLDLPK